MRFNPPQLDELYNLFKVRKDVTQHLMRHGKTGTSRLVFVCPQRQHFLSCYWTMKSPALLHHDPSLAYLEQYQLGFQQFSGLFSLLEPWAFCSNKSTLSLWVFRLIDENQDGLVNFREFCCALGESSSSAPLSHPRHPPAALTSSCFSHRYFIRRIFH